MIDSDKPMLRCTSCGMTTEAACSCGVRYEIMRPGEAAKQAKKAYPDKTDRAIAEMIGVSHPTVAAAGRSVGKDFPTDKSATTNTATRRRVGRDGKRYKATKSNQSRNDETVNKTEAVRQAVRPLVEAGKTVSRNKLAKELGVSQGTVQRATMQEQARLEEMGGGPKLFDWDWDSPEAIAKILVNSKRDKSRRLHAALAELLAITQATPGENEIMVSLNLLIEKFVPLFESVRDQSKRHEACVSQAELLLIASEGRRLLDRWADGDDTVRRVRGHVAPPKLSANGKEVPYGH